MMKKLEFEKDVLPNGQVATVNPLRVRVNRERARTIATKSLTGEVIILDTNVQYSSARKFLESKKRTVSIILLLLYFLLFILVPSVFLLYLNINAKTKGFFVILFAGIVQPWSIYILMVRPL